MRLHRGARAARGGLVALFATFVALMSHVAGGGEVPGWLGLFVPLVLAAAVSTVILGHRLSMVRLTLSVTASQLLFHTLFTVGAPGGAASLDGYVHGHHHTAMIATEAAASAVTHDHGGRTMWVAHAVAAVITVAGIYVGERSVLLAAAAVGEARAWLRRKTAIVAAPSVVIPDGSLWVVAPAARALRSLCVLPSDRRRGPPLSFGI
ncbi:hypothetical protein ACI2K6_16175 [Microbacterium sp. NPDC006705]|uniref:hypothetical protein n=1 Tax=Microbacterium TaxID=33882 RepID=UPI002B47E021|nr:hypothetical protein [Microbacterium plantarum]WRK17140.1 hypothetical protein VC184_14730 [Microbacterium plantarum]